MHKVEKQRKSKGAQPTVILFQSRLGIPTNYYMMHEQVPAGDSHNYGENSRPRFIQASHNYPGNKTYMLKTG